jgi:hypothetical protein
MYGHRQTDRQTDRRALQLFYLPLAHNLSSVNILYSLSSHVVISPNFSVGNSVYFKILTKQANAAQCHKISSAMKYVIPQKAF